MIYNVAQLLTEPIGSERNLFTDSQTQIDNSATEILPDGKVYLLRTDRGILVRASLEARLNLICGRCLISFQQHLRLSLEEEFLPLVDVSTGQSIRTPDDAEPSSIIDEHHMLDLTEASRQYCLTNQPMKPLCQPNCLGICQTCGSNKNDSHCTCDLKAANAQWEPLTQLLERTHH